MMTRNSGWQFANNMAADAAGMPRGRQAGEPSHDAVILAIIEAAAALVAGAGTYVTPEGTVAVAHHDVAMLSAKLRELGSRR